MNDQNQMSSAQNIASNSLLVVLFIVLIGSVAYTAGTDSKAGSQASCVEVAQR